MSWNKPQRVIKNILFYLSILSFMGAIFWIAIFYIWTNHPKMVSDYDNNIPDHYSNRITRLQTRTYKGKSPEDTFKRHQILAEALQGVTGLHKYYDLHTETQKFMIDYLLKENKRSEAEQLADKWQQTYPQDFNAKFKYADVLSLIDKDREIEYYQNVYSKHTDLFELNQRYVNLLLDQGQFDKAFEIAEYSATQNRRQNHLRFVYFYADEENRKFNAKTKIKVHKENHNKIANNHIVRSNISVNGLKKIRFDIDRLQVSSKIKELFFKIKTATKTYDHIEATPLHDLEIFNDSFKTTGTDPYVTLNLPADLIGLKENFEISAFINIEKAMKYVLNIITYHPELKVSCSATEEFKEDKAQRFYLKSIDGQYNSEFRIQQQHCQYLKVNLPSLQNFSFRDLSIKIAGVTLTKENIIELSAIKSISENNYRVKSEKPYIIFKFDKLILAQNIVINMNIGKQK